MIAKSRRGGSLDSPFPFYVMGFDYDNKATLYQNENSMTVSYLIFYLFSLLKILVNTCILCVFRIDNRQNFYVINHLNHSPFGKTKFNALTFGLCIYF